MCCNSRKFSYRLTAFIKLLQIKVFFWIVALKGLQVYMCVRKRVMCKKRRKKPPSVNKTGFLFTKLSLNSAVFPRVSVGGRVGILAWRDLGRLEEVHLWAGRLELHRQRRCQLRVQFCTQGFQLDRENHKQIGGTGRRYEGVRQVWKGQWVIYMLMHLLLTCRSCPEESKVRGVCEMALRRNCLVRPRMWEGSAYQNRWWTWVQSSVPTPILPYDQLEVRVQTTSCFLEDSVSSDWVFPSRKSCSMLR